MPRGGKEGSAALTVAQLKAHLKALGLSTSGNKAELVGRYDSASKSQESIDLQVPESQEGDCVPPPDIADVTEIEPAGGEAAANSSEEIRVEAPLEARPTDVHAEAAAVAEDGDRGSSSGIVGSAGPDIEDREALIRAVQDEAEAELAAAAEDGHRGSSSGIVGNAGPGIEDREALIRAVQDEAEAELAAAAEAQAAKKAHTNVTPVTAAPCSSAALAAAVVAATAAATATSSEDPGHRERLVQTALQHSVWCSRSVKSLAKTLLEVGKVTREELPRKPGEISPAALATLCKRFEEVREQPLHRYAKHLKPALYRRVHVGTMDYMDESHEAYRRTFDFLETTNTWHDTDLPWRDVPSGLQKIGCAFKPISLYESLAQRGRDGFKFVIKVSHVATHVMKLEEPETWWPMLYKEKYSLLSSCTAAFLWQFPPSFVFDAEHILRLEKLVTYLHSSASGCPEARHIVDFRSETWYRDETYEFLREKRWCLAWLHLNNSTGWASKIPSGWTDRVQTTNFCFVRLFGPDGVSHGYYDKRFLHELFDSCPAGATTYVLFGNRETLEDDDPTPRPALSNALEFRSIFTKMDFVERIRAVRYRGDCPRELGVEERLLLNSFYVRFSQRARKEGLKMSTPIGVTWAKKYYEQAPWEKRCFEWLLPVDGKRGEPKRELHMSLHDAKEEEDIWVHLRQLSGLESIEATEEWAKKAMERMSMGDLAEGGFTPEEAALVNGTFLRWSERARQAGLLSTTPLRSVAKDGTLRWTLSNGEALELSLGDLDIVNDVWRWFIDLSRVSSKANCEEEPSQDANPWQDESWKKDSGGMWRRQKEAEERAAEEAAARAAQEAEERAALIRAVQDKAEALMAAAAGAQSEKAAEGVEQRGERDWSGGKWPSYGWKETQALKHGDNKWNSSQESESTEQHGRAWEEEAAAVVPEGVSAKRFWGENDDDVAQPMNLQPPLKAPRISVVPARISVVPPRIPVVAPRVRVVPPKTSVIQRLLKSWSKPKHSTFASPVPSTAPLEGTEDMEEDMEEVQAEDLPGLSHPTTWSEWIRWESNDKPGFFFYRNTETNEETVDVPPPLQDLWERLPSADGLFYYFNKQTGEAQDIAPELP